VGRPLLENAKSSAERVRDFVRRKKEKGWVRKFVWIPNTLEANQELKELEKKLQEKLQEKDNGHT